MGPAAMTDPTKDEPETDEAVTNDDPTDRAVPHDEPLLEVRGLSVSYRTRGGTVRAVREVDLDVWPGQVTAVVGESGSGKSTTAHAITRLLAANGGIDAGTVRFGRHRDLTSLSERELRTVRGAGIGLVPQDPTVSLNPVKRIGEQVAEVLRIHQLATRRSAASDAIEILDRAGLPDAATRARQYPHELSGGMRQRALIAIAIAGRPQLIIADEPTSALDVTVQRVILDHLQLLTEESGTAVLLVTHDLGVAADRAQRIVVMSEGRVVEAGPTRAILDDPRHDYTRRLLASAPSLATARPRVPVPAPSARKDEPLVELRNVVKEFRLPSAKGPARVLRAVDDVSFTLHRGRTLALVGESGSGKSTTARLALRLTDPTSGHILFDGADVTNARGAQARRLRRRAQLVYQNPYASLDPRFSIGEVIIEPLRAFKVGDRVSRTARARELLDRVALPAATLERRPAELSGGQRQRVAIARALALSPDLVVCDEPVSALDVSVQAQVLDLLAELQADTGVAYLFISHDLAVVRQIAHQVAVMRSGRIVETGTSEDLFADPRHSYTRELLAAIPGGRYASATTVEQRADEGESADPIKERT
ncbi:ABC transporter ATP-binding protein [Streptomyces sp. NPDC001815]|uniref:ABC transporter ATP-binding protein n=1 Tax=Streptomyces sp. NPDC001815 TaxID=3154526 RepID=UPI00331BE1C6